MSDNSIDIGSFIQRVLHNPGVPGVSVLDFSGVPAALSLITIGGREYQEADTEDFPNGVWTNGLSAADAATSLVSAINGDTRTVNGVEDAPFTAVRSVAGDSVVIIYENPGELTTAQAAVSLTAATNTTVETFHEDINPFISNVILGRYTVSAQDVLADELNIPLAQDFNAATFMLWPTTSAGVFEEDWTTTWTLQTSPNRLRGQFTGATDPVAGDIVNYMVLGNRR